MSVILNGGSVLLDSGSVATNEDCCCGPTCCDALEPFTTLTLSGTISGCAGGSGSMGTVVYTRVVAAPGCDLNMHEWSKDSNCGCQFQAQCCVPFVEVGEIHTDNTNDDCNDPDYAFCGLIAVIDCNNANVQFLADSLGTGGSPCCTTAGNLTSGFYAIPASPGSINVSLAGSGGLTFNIDLAFA